MDWMQVLVMIGANLGAVITLFLQSDNRTEAHRRETFAILKGISDEMKDFHGRLCALEERKIKILEK